MKRAPWYLKGCAAARSWQGGVHRVGPSNARCRISVNPPCKGQRNDKLELLCRWRDFERPVRAMYALDAPCSWGGSGCTDRSEARSALDDDEPLQVLALGERHGHRVVRRRAQACVEGTVDAGVQARAGDDLVEQVGAHASGA